MKNIHILKTPNPSRLSYDFDINQYYLQKEVSFWEHQNMIENRNIYITSDEEIKEGDWCLYNKNHDSKCPFWELVKCGTIERKEMHPISNGKLLLWMKKIILTTDQDLIKDGVQPIDNEFLEWFIKNPSCENVDIGTSLLDGKDGYGYYGKYKIIIPKEEPKPVWQQIIETCGGEEEFMKSAGLLPKQETLEEFINSQPYYGTCTYEYKEGIGVGAKWQQEQDKNKYSEEELKSAFKIGFNIGYGSPVQELDLKNEHCERWFEQFKKK